MHQRTSFSGPISHLSQQAILVSSEGTHKRGENFPRTQIWLPGCIRLHVPFWTCISINSFASLQRLFMRNHYSDWFSSWSISSIPMIPARVSICWKQSAPVQLLCSAGGGAAGPFLCFHHHGASSLLLSCPRIIAAAGQLARMAEVRLELVC